MSTILPLLPPILSALVSAAALLFAARIARATSVASQRQALFQFLFGIWKQDQREQEKIIAEIMSGLPSGRKQTDVERSAFLTQLRRLQVNLMVNDSMSNSLLTFLASPPQNERSDLDVWQQGFSSNIREHFKELATQKSTQILLQIEDKKQ